MTPTKPITRIDMKASERELSSTMGFRDTDSDFSAEEELALEALEVEAGAVVDV